MYLWSKLSSIQWNDAWEERFYGNTNAVIEEIKGGKSIRVQLYCETEAEALRVQESFGGSIREVKSAKWEAPQDLTHKPLLIRDRLVLTQTVSPQTLTDLKARYPDRIVLNIPAEMAFGTGDHPTTANCLRFLVDYAKAQRTEWNMIDVGCGTGVIAMAAARLGASDIAAFDFDPKAVEVAKKNLKPNEAEHVSVFTEDVFLWKPEVKYSLIVANLFSSILQNAFPILLNSLKHDGTIVISGILATQWEETREAGEQAGLSFLKVKQSGKWVTARGCKAG